MDKRLKTEIEKGLNQIIKLEIKALGIIFILIVFLKIILHLLSN